MSTAGLALVAETLIGLEMESAAPPINNLAGTPIVRVSIVHPAAQIKLVPAAFCELPVLILMVPQFLLDKLKFTLSPLVSGGGMITVDCVALRVKPATLPKSNTVPERTTIVNVPVPKLIVLVPEPAAKNVFIVALGLLTEKSNVKPADAAVVLMPESVLFELNEDVTVTTAPLEFASKIATSADDGTLAPPGPPVAEDQCVVSELSHVPLPATQNLLAMIIPLYRPAPRQQLPHRID